MQISVLETLEHSGRMDSAKGVSSVSQRSTQGLPSSSNVNARSSESVSSDISRPVLNYSIQTGEEFALEFMRATKKTSTQNTSSDQNIGTNYMELRHVLGISNMGSESGSDVSLFGLGETQLSKGMGKKNLSEHDHERHFTSSRSAVQVPSDEGSSRGVPQRYGSSDPSNITSKKMKFLCSLGGKILPRPSDSKLRYVGGDTRIIQVNKEITFEDLVQKTMTFCKKPHTIKYQLPGEDLDALVSVSCDEDLQNMIEECSVLEGSEGSQKLRMFLFTSDDIDDVNFNLATIDGESEMQYFFAVNGMDLIAGKVSSDHGVASTSASDLDQFLNFNGESGRTNTDIVSSESIGALNAFSLPPSSATVTRMVASNDFDQNIHQFEDHKDHYANGRNYAYSDGDPIDGFQILVNSVPLSVPPSYQFKYNHSSKLPVRDKECFHPRVSEGQFGVIDSESLSGMVSSSNIRTLIKATKSEDTKKGDEICSPGTESVQQQEAFVASCVDAEGPAAKTATEHIISRLHPVSSGQKLETGQTSLSTDTVNPGYSSELKEDYQCTSDGAFSSRVSDHYDEVNELSQSNIFSHPYRGYKSERIPRNQPKFLSRLSKSNDFLGSHLMSNDNYCVPEETAVQIVDSVIEESIVSDTYKSSSVAEPQCSTSAITDDGSLKLEKHKPRSKKINLTEQFEPLSSQIASEIARASYQHGNIYAPQSSLDSHAVSEHSDIIGGELSNKLGIEIQKSQLQSGKLSFAGNKLTPHEATILHEQNANKHIMQTITGELAMPKNKEKGIHADGVVNQQKNPAYLFSAVGLEETSTKDSHIVDIAENPIPFPSVGNSIGVVFEEAYSAPVSGKQDVSSDINDQFPPDLLSDFLSNTTTTVEMSHGDALLKVDARLNLNLQNYDPKRWPFFRNLVQDESAHNKGVSLMDQDHIDYSSLLPKVEEGISRPYHFGPVETGVDYSQIDPQISSVEEMHRHASSTIIDDSITVDSVCISSQITHPRGLGNGEGFQVDNPFSKLRETLRTHVSEYEDLKFDVGEMTEPVIDTSEWDSNFDHLQIIRSEDLEDLRELGSGTFGTVYHGKWRGTDVAIKRIKKSCLPGRSSQQEKLTIEFWREAGILSQLHHPNVVAFYGVVKDGPGATLATVTEFMVNGSLRQVLLRKDKYLDRRKRLVIAMDAAFGMEYLHSKNIVHFDLKCDNLLVNLKDQSRPICKVGDFGLSKIKRNTLVSGGVRGTLPWMAPELLSGSSNKVSEKVDVFSFGIVMWEILTGEEPYANMHYGAIIGGIVNNTLRPPIPVTCDPEWRRLMEQCWAPDPLQRPSFTEIASRLRAMSVAIHMKLVK